MGLLEHIAAFIVIFFNMLRKIVMTLKTTIMINCFKYVIVDMKLAFGDTRKLIPYSFGRGNTQWTEGGRVRL